MNVQPHNRSLNQSGMQAFLAGTVPRIQRTTIVLGLAGSIAATMFFGWRNGLGCVIGATVGYLNLIWLHRDSSVMIERLLTPAANAPSKFRLMLSFGGRYIFVIAIAYAILKGFSGMRLGFIVALFFPILAAMGEGVYEVCVNVKTNKVRNETSLH